MENVSRGPLGSKLNLDISEEISTNPNGKKGNVQINKTRQASRIPVSLGQHRRPKNWHNKVMRGAQLKKREIQPNVTLESKQNNMNDNIENNLNNNTIDYIEMLTLDAREFVKCSCEKSETNFCKDCFTNMQKTHSSNEDVKKSREEVLQVDKCAKELDKKVDDCIQDTTNHDFLLMAESFLNLKLLAQKLRGESQAYDYKNFVNILDNIKESCEQQMTQKRANGDLVVEALKQENDKFVLEQVEKGNLVSVEDKSLVSSGVADKENLDAISNTIKEVNVAETLSDIDEMTESGCSEDNSKQKNVDTFFNTLIKSKELIQQSTINDCGIKQNESPEDSEAGNFINISNSQEQSDNTRENQSTDSRSLIKDSESENQNTIPKNLDQQINTPPSDCNTKTTTHLLVQAGGTKEKNQDVILVERDLDPINASQHLVNPPDSSGTLQRESCASSRTRSIDADVRQEQAPLSSRESDVGVAPDDDAAALSGRVSQNCSATATNGTYSGTDKQLTWSFQNGRLVFVEEEEDEPPVSSCSSTDGPGALLSSKALNRRSDGARIKYLEGKLKQAAQAHSYSCPGEEVESSSSPKLVDYSEFHGKQAEQERSDDAKENSIEGEDLIPDGSHDFCQFDVSDFAGFCVAQQNSELYNEYIEESSSSSDSCDCGEEDHFIVIRRTCGDGAIMVNDTTSERSKHNPDRDNLKSLLKRPGRGRDNKKSNRVIFNENKNEFFDADYIILIREDCELDEDDEDGVCTCQQHEMVRLTCCEPNCNCQYEGAGEPTPQSPKFAPPMEFVDAVTLSPPEGYKDMELMSGRRGPVCRECSATHEEDLEDEGEASQSDSDMDAGREQEEKEKTDQSQQTTPTTPPSVENSSYILDTLTNTKVAQQYSSRSAEDIRRTATSQGSPISGILKGGRLWKQQSTESNFVKNSDLGVHSSDSVTSDEETTMNNKRSVRFIESVAENDEKRVSCDGAPEEELLRGQDKDEESPNNKPDYGTSPTDAVDMTLRFGNHLLIPSENSLKPNSAVRQLFSCTKSLATPQVVQIPEEEDSQQYLVTAESLKAFEEAKRSKLPQIIQSGDIDEPIKRAIERNTLRRSLIRYEPRNKRQPYKNDNSLVERIKQLTCNVDAGAVVDNANSCDDGQTDLPEDKLTGDALPHESSQESSEPSEDVLDSRVSPPGEESRISPDVNTLSANNKSNNDKSFSPSSSSTASSSSSMSISQQNYNRIRKLSNASEQVLMLDLNRVNSVPDIQNNFRRDAKPLPDIGGPHNHDIPPELPRVMTNPPDLPGHCVIANRMSSSSNTSESRRQFLSSLTPLAACVSMGGGSHHDDYYYHLSNHHPHLNQPSAGERVSVASSGTEYSLEDIEEGLNKTEDEEQKRIAPDVLAGTPSASESGDELAMFVQQDAGRIERIKKKYLPVEQQQQHHLQQQQQQVQNQQHKDNKNHDDEDDEHDDYGFNRRPNVRGIKPRFSTTTEILQQIQNQLQPPAPPATRVAWPYYSESDNSKQKNANYAYINVGEEVIKTRNYPPQYRPPATHDESLYQNCANQMCVSREMYQRTNANVYVRTNNDCYQSLPRQRTERPHSPPPMDMSRQYHQTMVYIPYNHIDGYQPVQYYQQTGTSEQYVSRVSSQNQINKRYVEPVYQSRGHHHADEHHYNPNAVPPVPPKMNRVSYPNGQAPTAHHVMMGGSRSESPLPGQFSTARSTQTPVPSMSQCGYYPGNPRYRPVVGPVWQGEGNYATKVNRHSFPAAVPRYPPADSISLTDSDSQHSGSIPNGYRPDLSIPNSPTKPRFIERGVPEGAASVSPQDMSGVSQSSSSTMTSPTSPQNPHPVPAANQKPVFYAMNV